jgi:hypothetical protein
MRRFLADWATREEAQRFGQSERVLGREAPQSRLKVQKATALN